ncbi:hypothetical protein KA025_02495 [Candidatus Saccharibacteria bacterium]|nr:hypothetical protein [Candidatus Saccharibacteria bacterium]
MKSTKPKTTENKDTKDEGKRSIAIETPAQAIEAMFDICFNHVSLKSLDIIDLKHFEAYRANLMSVYQLALSGLKEHNTEKLVSNKKAE